MLNSEEIVDRPKNLGKGRPRSNSYDRAISEGLPANSRLAAEDPPPPVTQPRSRPPDDDFYSVKWIDFNYERLPILLQNGNGPCPLLALANNLLLRKQIRFDPNAGVVSTDRVIATIADYMLQIDSSRFSHEKRVNFERNLHDALAVLDKLKTGIDVNLKFNGVEQFEYTHECIIFDVLGIRLFHGWVLDPQNRELQRIVDADASSYNQLVEKMIVQRQSKRDDLVRDSLLIEQFLEENRSQLTFYGLVQLNEAMEDRELAVFFRNNHFSTIWNNKKQLLVLVSDQGYADHPSIVFETLTGIDNDSIFTDGYGRAWQKPTTPNNYRDDRALAVAIHSTEQQRYNQTSHSQGHIQEQYPEKPKRRKSTQESGGICTLF